MTVDEARQYINNSIQLIYDQDEAGNISDILLEHITGFSRTQRLSGRLTAIDPAQIEMLDSLLSQLKTHKPIQYVIREAWFWKMKFYVNEHVLIPRPETEELVKWIVDDSSRIPSANRILDLGTGSGCIAISLKTELGTAEICAWDKEEGALDVARMNAKNLNVDIDFINVDFLDHSRWGQLPDFDLIVSNPPYVPIRDRAEMKRTVIDFEPASALFVSDDDPLIFYTAIADFGHQHLQKAGRIYVEVHEMLARPVLAMFHSKGYVHSDLKKDMQGKERMIKVAKI